MRPARCDRSREAISLRLDGTLSTFEAVLLERHLRGCGDCRSFADAAAAQTALLRAAALEEPSRRVTLPEPRRRPLRRVAGSALTAVAATAAAAALTLNTGGSGETSAAKGAPVVGAPVLVTVAAQPSPGMKEIVPRLTMQPASIADGPVHGLFSTPVRA